MKIKLYHIRLRILTKNIKKHKNYIIKWINKRKEFYKNLINNHINRAYMQNNTITVLRRFNNVIIFLQKS